MEITPKHYHIFLGSDHAGFDKKGELFSFLQREGITVTDVGSSVKISDDDYPDVAKQVARRIKGVLARGVLLCGSGVGVCIVANKVPGVRAVNATSVEMARDSRNDDDTNCLCLAANYLTVAEMKKILMVWLSTPFSNEARHIRRLRKIDKR